MCRLTSFLMCIALGSLLVGCEREPPNRSTPQQASDPDLKVIGEAYAEMLAADTRLEMAAAAWPIVLLHEATPETIDYGYDGPITMTMTLASSAEGWSVCEATRPIAPGASPDTIRSELITFAFRLPWFPTKEAHPYRVNSGDDSGATELLEWKFEDLGDSTTQRLKLSFRLRSNR